ncbi:MAG: acetylxylan esterase [Candidatus Glassbacteria bacterium]|nr:acetylxylan esterase [Candidatus Glassbacteria bacterium]
MFAVSGSRSRKLCGLILFAAAAFPAVAPDAGILLAWDRGTVAYDNGYQAVVEPVFPADSTHLLPPAPHGPSIPLRIINNSGREITGALLYAGATDFRGNGVQDLDRRIDLPAHGETTVELALDRLAGKPGFYDVRVLVFDRGRELAYDEFTFGYDVSGRPVDIHPPADFDRFWQATLDSLKAVPPGVTMQLDSLLSTGTVDVYRVSYASLHRVRVHGWYTVPRWKPGPHAALLFLPGYSTGRISPKVGHSGQGFATLSIQVRGYGVDQEDYPPDNRSYMTIGVDDPETFVYREIVCHCLRGIDFLELRPEVDRGRICAIGGSQGGGLSLLAGGLDKRVGFIVAGVPFLTDFPLSMEITGNPCRNLVWYLEENPGKKEKVFRTLSYFDVLNVAARIKVPTLVSMGLWDRTCPAPAIYEMFLALGSADKEIGIYPYLDHGEVGGPHGPVVDRWLDQHLRPGEDGKAGPGGSR